MPSPAGSHGATTPASSTWTQCHPHRTDASDERVVRLHWLTVEEARELDVQIITVSCSMT